MALTSIILLCALLPHMSYSAWVKVGIVNGTEAKPHSRPYMVSVQYEGKHACGGFLVSERFVMTAAHCRKDNQELTVVVGAHDLRSNDFSRITVKTYNTHPEYEDKPCLHNDIMLLELLNSTKKSGHVDWITIPEKKEDVKANSKCSVAGWGRQTLNGPISNCLMEATVSVIDAETCKAHWGRCYSKSILCAGGLRHGFCQKDSGGPLVCDGTAVGIVGFYEEKNCERPQKPNAYTKISEFLSWIEKILNGSKYSIHF